MKQAVLVKANTPEEFVEVYNETCASLSRFCIERQELISATSMYIFYDISDDIPEIEQNFCFSEPDDFEECSGRYCAECDNYEWGKRCIAGMRRIKPTSPACHLFNVDITGNARQ